MATFTLPESDDPHRVGDPDCDQGWCRGYDYPTPCEDNDCPGLVHAEWGDNVADGYYLITRCDTCDPYLERQ